MSYPTFKSLIDSTLHMVSGGRSSDDDLPERELVAQFWLDYRALYIRRDVEKNRFLSAVIEQDFGCVELEKVDKAECCEIEVDCQILRTVKKIPRPIRLNDKDLFTYVGSVDKHHNWKIIRPYEAQWRKFNKYVGKLNRIYYKNDYFYVLTDNDMLKYMNIRGVPYDPRDIVSFNCTTEDCFTENTEFPLPPDMIQSIREQIFTKELHTLLRIPTDITNDNINTTQRGDKV